MKNIYIFFKIKYKVFFIFYIHESISFRSLNTISSAFKVLYKLLLIIGF